jgi:hypothetical protein
MGVAILTWPGLGHRVGSACRQGREQVEDIWTAKGRCDPCSSLTLRRRDDGDSGVPLLLAPVAGQKAPSSLGERGQMPTSALQNVRVDF